MILRWKAPALAGAFLCDEREEGVFERTQSDIDQSSVWSRRFVKNCGNILVYLEISRQLWYNYICSVVEIRKRHTKRGRLVRL